ncbi:unnamed protein product [Nippostrongylus brasiliensis]|uniref:FA_desaturase domain-containing protein n=1 Tax=Nippostrongylus brasiliensis TaxID=27835 RepID=A0A0N4Y3D8_NIPBR|nr:unnamed protein product [Nippostrongylus brasiliensis]
MTIPTTTQSRKAQADELISSQFLAAELDEVEQLLKQGEKIPYKMEIVWRNVILFAMLHVGAVIGFYQLIFVAKWATVFWSLFLHVVGAIGITAGAHRLWSHRAYKANLPYRILLMIMDTTAFQNDIIEWARDHRCHHKWTDTHADPHNTNRGFFFSHMGWLLVKKHPQIKEQGKKLDLSDLFADPVLVFQRRYYLPMVILLCFLMPAAIPVKLWGESALVAFYTASLFRYCFLLHSTWFINSVAHMFGYRPYDTRITPVESVWTSVTAVGEGGHNFHHTFPQDYRASEYSLKLNWTCLFIDAFAAIGWVYDRKSVSEEYIKRQCAKYGDPDKRDKWSTFL